MVTRFAGQYAFLSNFSPHPVLLPQLSDIPFATAEHAFQAAKTQDPVMARWVAGAPTPGEAKKRGRRVRLRPDWEAVRRLVMFDVLRGKFDVNGSLAQLLAGTDGELVEGNTWGDIYWGAVPMDRGTIPPGMSVWAPGDDSQDIRWLAGHNWLGRELMMLRELIRA